MRYAKNSLRKKRNPKVTRMIINTDIINACIKEKASKDCSDKVLILNGLKTPNIINTLVIGIATNITNSICPTVYNTVAKPNKIVASIKIIDIF